MSRRREDRRADAKIVEIRPAGPPPAIDRSKVDPVGWRWLMRRLLLGPSDAPDGESAEGEAGC